MNTLSFRLAAAACALSLGARSSLAAAAAAPSAAPVGSPRFSIAGPMSGGLPFQASGLGLSLPAPLPAAPSLGQGASLSPKAARFPGRAAVAPRKMAVVAKNGHFRAPTAMDILKAASAGVLKEAGAGAELSAAFDGVLPGKTFTGGGMPQAPEMKLTKKQLALTALSSQESLLGAVEDSAYGAGYLSIRNDSRAANFLDKTFGDIIKASQEAALKLHASGETVAADALDASLNLFWKLRLISQDSYNGYPNLRFGNNYVFDAAYKAVLSRGRDAGSIEEVLAVADDVRARLLDKQFAEQAFLSVVFPMYYSFLKKLLPADSRPTLRDLAAAHANAYQHFLENRGLAPSEAAFQDANSVFLSLSSLQTTLASLPGMTESLLQRTLMNSGFIHLIFAGQGVRNHDQAEALVKGINEYLQSFVEGFPLLWARDVLNRLFDKASEIGGERNVSPETMSPRTYQGLLKEAAAALEEEDAPSEEARSIADSIQGGVMRMMRAIAAYPNATMDLLIRAMNSQPFQAMIQEGLSASTPEEAEAFASKLKGQALSAPWLGAHDPNLGPHI